jgi:hypothetical protein
MMWTPVVRRLGGFREPFLGAEDFDLWLRMCEYAHFAGRELGERGIDHGFKVSLASRPALPVEFGFEGHSGHFGCHWLARMPRGKLPTADPKASSPAP